MITWVDVLLAVLVAVLTAAGVHRRLIGLFVGLGAALALGPLLRLGQSSPWTAVAVAAVLGLVLGLLGRRLYDPGRGPVWPYQVLGGVGGAVLGAALVVALITSLPISRSARGLHYPPHQPDTALYRTLNRSPLVLVGRTIVFYPVLPAEELAKLRPYEQRVYAGLHDVFVPGEPWSTQ
ncbi:MAG TPA: hypothetical protein VFF08_07220 [Trueperaceae bacterium]|nr:hypothetical protein [Trueperaceae bacterium]